jgi:hypothetical protein
MSAFYLSAKKADINKPNKHLANVSVAKGYSSWHRNQQKLEREQTTFLFDIYQ